ncbi:eukaryotic translation initiation factor 4G [Pyrus ussuriensis x Pyrus communis]|uniref:Eukaryotic translation initiation factor 4G n=1 Tax=Pyrus ussuriensis x Pyrus communis TaxID=2448454 RepID=A0A5N5G3A1_9ROSA|nr:eukaryotic translation initiation factor 4G [Pyrus ussuriensis x Pyrus communis]
MLKSAKIEGEDGRVCSAADTDNIFKKHINNAQGGAKASVATVNTRIPVLLLPNTTLYKMEPLYIPNYMHASRTAEASASQKSSRTFPKAPTSQRSSRTVPKLPLAIFPVHMPSMQLTLLFPAPLQDTGLP